MPGEPEVGIGEQLSANECRKAKPGTLFSSMKNTSNTLQHDYGNITLKNRCLDSDNNDIWEEVLEEDNRLRLCQASFQTDWKRGTLLRLVTKGTASGNPPKGYFLGLENFTVEVVDLSSFIVSDPTNVIYNYRPSGPSSVDPNSYAFVGSGYTKWEIIRTGTSSVVGGTGNPNLPHEYKLTSTGTGVVLFTGSVNVGGFPVGVPATNTWSDIDFTFTSTLGGLPVDEDRFPYTQRSTMTYELRLS